MNRRKPIKKNYFAFLSDFSRIWLIIAVLFLVLAVVFLGSLFLPNNGAEASGENIVAVLAMIAIPLLLVTALYLVFEKITGLSILAGVEWVGRKTLASISWVINTLKSSLGLTASDDLDRHLQATREEDEQTLASEPEQLIADTAMIENADSTSIIDAASAETDWDQEQQEIETDSLAVAMVDDEVIDPLSMVLDTKDETIASTLVSEILVANIDTEPDKDPEVNVPESIEVDLVLQKESDNDTSFEDFETELKSFYQENGSGNTDSEQISPIDNIAKDLDPIELLSEPRGNEEFNALNGAEKPDYMIAALQAAKDKLQSNKGFVSNDAQRAEGSNSPTFSLEQSSEDTQLSALPDTTDTIIQALQSAAKNKISSEQEQKDTDETGTIDTDQEQPSLLDQAEQTATSLFSAISDRVSRSLGFHLKPVQVQPDLPAIELLQQHQQSVHAYSTEELEAMSRTVERVLKDYKVIAEVAGAYPGPIITRFELSLAPGVKVSRVSGLAKDLARAMLVTSVRVVDIIEGTPYIGLEIPNQERELVSFREIIASETFLQAESPLTLALGKDVSGQTVVSDLGKMPHLLVAGTTGSGKSVAINTMILSMLYKATPDQVRMIMIDPKMLELSVYEGIPHLLTPVVTDMKEAQNSLRWAVAEMERRYLLMSKVGVRNLAGYNQKITDAAARGETIRDPLFQLNEALAEGESFPVLSTLPSIVIIIDELADMMMIVGKKVEELIARLAQKARASGIHLILATQRPSVDVLTGLIKANVPTRISFQVSSRIDSRTILDQGGAESLLGNGDMLFLPSGTSVPIRSHGAFVDDHEVHAVVNYLKSFGATNYLFEIVHEASADNMDGLESASEEVDVLYDAAVSFVFETGRASISSVQRRFKVGYNRAARMIDKMEAEKIVSEPEGNGSRRVLNRDE